jgi:hypothetical protein
MLRKQLAVATAKERTITGAGFFTDFSIQENVARINPRKPFMLKDVGVEINGVPNAGAFLLLVKDGVIDQLEGYTLALDKWAPTRARGSFPPASFGSRKSASHPPASFPSITRCEFVRAKIRLQKSSATSPLSRKDRL